MGVAFWLTSCSALFSGFLGPSQLYSVFDWRLLYRVPTSCVPWGRGRPSSVTCLLPMRLKGKAALMVGYHDGCYSVWTREYFGSIKCQHVVIAHSDALDSLAESGGQVISGS